MCQKIIISVVAGLLCLFSSVGLALDMKEESIDSDDTVLQQDYRRFALVIGNQDYEESKLANPINDAQAIKDFLVSRQFSEEDILYVKDADLQTMESTIDIFIQRLSEAKKSVAFVYYSGHGVQEMSRKHNELTNYLIPINNKKIKLITDLDYHSVSLNQLLSKLHEVNHGLNIVLMDACRNEWRSFNRSMFNASFAPISAKGVFIAYATASGNTAADDSLFRKSFIQNASQVKKLTDVFNDVKRAFNETSQLPVVEDRTAGDDFYFTGSADDDPRVLKANYYLAKTFENKALLAFMKGDKSNNLREYHKAWLYGLEAEKLRMPEGQVALKQNTLNQLTSLSVRALIPEKYSIPTALGLGLLTGGMAITYSPDGSIIASGGIDGKIKFWGAKSGKLQQMLKGYEVKSLAAESTIVALSYSPDGNILASMSFAGSIKLWNVKSGQLKMTFKEKYGLGLGLLSYSPNGNILAVASETSIDLWDIKSGQLKQTFELKESEGTIGALSYRSDGRVFAAVLKDKNIKLWDVKLGVFTPALKGHEGKILSLNYSPDGHVLISILEDKYIKLWDVQLGKFKQTFKWGDLGGNSNMPMPPTLGYSLDGQSLAAIGFTGIKLWDIASGQSKQAFEGHETQITVLNYSTDGREFASGSSGGVIKRWDTKSGQLKQTLKGDNEGVSTLSYSPNGRILATATEGNTIKLWDTTTGQLKQTLKGHTESVRTLSYSPDGDVLSSGSSDGKINLWDTTSGLLKRTLIGHKNIVLSIAYIPDGHMLSSGSSNGTIKYWDAKSGQLKKTLKGHETAVNTLHYHPNGNTLASGADDKLIKLWDTKTGELKQTLKGQKEGILSLSYSSDGRTLAAGSWGGLVKHWDVQSGEIKQELKHVGVTISGLRYSPDGKVLASSSGLRITLSDAKTGPLKQMLEWYENGSLVHYSPNGKVLASVDSRTIKLLDAQSGQLKKTIRVNGQVEALSYSPDGNILVSGMFDGTINFWDVKSGQLKQTVKGEDHNTIRALSYSPNGRILAVSGIKSNMIKLWDIKSGKFTQTLKGYENGEATALSYSPDGRVLASASLYDGTITLWDTTSDKRKQTIKDGKNDITTLTYSSDGRTLVSGSSDGVIKLWDVRSGKLKQVLKGHENEVLALSYHSNVITSVPRKGAIRLWTSSMLKTQNLFYKYDPTQVLAALQFLWEMGLGDDGLTVAYKMRTPNLYHKRYYADTEFLPLLDSPPEGKTKADQLIEWLENKKAYKKY